MTICSTASIQTSTPTTAAIWLRTSAPTATPMTLYAAMTTNAASTICQNCAAKVYVAVPRADERDAERHR